MTLDGLRATPCIIRSLVEIATPEPSVWKPTTERWSICESQSSDRCREVERRLRVRRMLEENLPSFEDYDPAVRSEQGAHANDDGVRALESFCVTRASSLEWLDKSTLEDWARRARH